MTQEKVNILFKDLSARLPYDNTIISVNDGTYRKDVKLHPRYIFDWDAERWDAKPYLRPMSSMTEKERGEYKLFIFDYEYDDYWNPGKYSDAVEVYIMSELIDWLNAHHFDYRGLIEKGLALEATEGMYEVN